MNANRLKKWQDGFNHIDKHVTSWMARYGIVFLRISLGTVFFWFGFLKFFPGMSPAEGLAARTIELLTFGLMPPSISIPFLAVWESLVGIGLIFNLYMRVTLLLLFVQMLGTIMPIFLFPQEVFVITPLVPTLEGQYIIKNLVIISAGLVLGATVRGGAVVDDPRIARLAEEDQTNPKKPS